MFLGEQAETHLSFTLVSYPGGFKNRSPSVQYDPASPSLNDQTLGLLLLAGFWVFALTFASCYRYKVPSQSILMCFSLTHISPDCSICLLVRAKCVRCLLVLSVKEHFCVQCVLSILARSCLNVPSIFKPGTSHIINCQSWTLDWILPNHDLYFNHISRGEITLNSAY